MKYIIILLVLSQFGLAQPRPTGNVLTDSERKILFEDFVIKEKELISKINGHIKKCYPRFEGQKTLPDLLISYRLFLIKKEKNYECTSEELNCVQSIPAEIKTIARKLLNTPSIEDHFSRKYKLSHGEAKILKIDLKKWLETTTEDELKNPVHNNKS